MDFCHLHTHARGSFWDGLNPIEELVDRAVELKQPGIALTDHGVMYGATSLFKRVRHWRSQGVVFQGIIGMEAYEAIPERFILEDNEQLFKTKWADLPEGVWRYHHLTLWALNETGYRNLVALHTQSFTKPYKPKNQPLIDRYSLERHADGIAVGLGCPQSRTNVAIAQGGDGYAEARWYVERFEGRVFMEVMANLPEQQAALRPQRKLAKRLGIPCVATNDTHYRDQADGVLNGAHHVLVQGRRFRKADTEESADRSDEGFGQWYGSDGFFMKSGQQMLETGGLLPDEIARSCEVLDLGEFDIAQLPQPQPPIPVVPEPGADMAFEEWQVRLTEADWAALMPKANT